jgi:hypothetical protein
MASALMEGGVTAALKFLYTGEKRTGRLYGTVVARSDFLASVAGAGRLQGLSAGRGRCRVTAPGWARPLLGEAPGRGSRAGVAALGAGGSRREAAGVPSGAGHGALGAGGEMRGERESNGRERERRGERGRNQAAAAATREQGARLRARGRGGGCWAKWAG